MADDIASLGFAVDSSQVGRARDELGRFTTAAKQAQGAVEGFQQSTQKAGNAAGQFASRAAEMRKVKEFVAQYDVAVHRSLNAGPDMGRGADIAAYGDELDNLRAKFNPLFAAERQYLALAAEIDKAARVGALSEDERVAALGRAELGFQAQARAAQVSQQAMLAMNKNIALSSFQLSNLSFQLNDVLTLTAMGADPVRILASQFGQIYQILQQGQGGVGGSLRYLGQLLTGLITPARLAVAGVAGLGAAGIAAASSWRSTQKEIELALSGIGAAAGVSARDITRIADASSATSALTVAESRKIALAIASTGKVGAETTAQLVALAEPLGRLFGDDTIAGAERLTKAFADPAKGVDDLNARLAVYDAATRQRIQSLVAQNRTQEAQNLLLRGSVDAIKAAGGNVGILEKLWNDAATAARGYLEAAGNAIDRSLGGGSLEQQLRAAQEQLAKAQKANFLGIGASPEFIADIAARVADLTDKLQKLNKAQAEAPANQRSLALSDAIRSAVPDIAALETATDALERLKKAMLDPAAFSRLPAADQANLQRAIQLRSEEVASIELKIAKQRTSAEIAQQENAFAIEAINARTTAERAEIAYRQTLAREERTGNTAAQIAAAGAAATVLAEENRRVGDEIRSRNFAARQSIELATLELSLVGKTADEAARITAAFRARQEVEAAAFQSSRTVLPNELVTAERNARDMAKVESDIRRKQLIADLEFERAQMGRTATEQSVYARLQSAGLLENGAIADGQAQAIADRIRFNEELQRTTDIQREFAGTFLRDMVAGKSAIEAAGNALDRLASKLLDSAIDNLVSGLGQGTGGGLLGGTLIPGILHDGGTVGAGGYGRRSVSAHAFAGARRYHNGGIVGLRPDEEPAILQKGEIVLPRGESAGGNVNVPIVINIDASGAYPETTQQLRGALERLKAELPGRITAQVRTLRNDRRA